MNPARSRFLFSFLLLLASTRLFAQAGDVIVEPKILTLSIPEYSQAARDAGIGGDVFVVVFVDKKGQPKGRRFLRAGGAVLEP